MTTRTVRKIVNIDEELCNGCGACVIKCAEGALQIIDGKVKLISDNYCDGLGACLGECPQGAINITERPAEEFDEVAVEHHLHSKAHLHQHEPQKTLACGCPSSSVRQFAPEEEDEDSGVRKPVRSLLGHFPVQLTLVPPHAPFLQGADLLLAADCTPFAYGGFHEDFLKGHALLIACPKLDDFEAHQEKLAQVLAEAKPKSLTVLRMEVPCCGGLTNLAKQAAAAAGYDTPIQETIISARGEVVKKS